MRGQMNSYIRFEKQKWARDSGVGMALIDPGKPWQNGVDESFNGKFWDECLSWNGSGTGLKQGSGLSSGGATTTRSDRIAAWGTEPPGSSCSKVVYPQNPGPFSKNEWSEKTGQVGWTASIRFISAA
jgi:Integrase core domain